MLAVAINCSHFRYSILESLRESAEEEGWEETCLPLNYNAVCFIIFQRDEPSRLRAKYETKNSPKKEKT